MAIFQLLNDSHSTLCHRKKGEKIICNVGNLIRTFGLNPRKKRQRTEAQEAGEFEFDVRGPDDQEDSDDEGDDDNENSE